MKIIKYPEIDQWEAVSQRPLIDNSKIESIVSDILREVKENGDSALNKFREQFDKVAITEFEVTKSELINAENEVSDSLKVAIQLAKQNIEAFHSAQLQATKIIETTTGVNCWRKSVGIEKVGLYIPGGSAPLFSTLLMLAIPAKIAGCREVIVCTPPAKDGGIHPAIRYTAQLLGIEKIYKTGGAQAIGAMAFGTATIPKVYKIFGPGNQFVTKAKEMVQLNGVAIDMPAGPSEVLVIADESAVPEFVAADLLSQAEHGPDSQVMLVSNSNEMIQKVQSEIVKQLPALPRFEIAQKAMENSRSILFKSREDCIRFSNYYAPEHLIIASEKALEFADSITNAGSVFLGNYSCESAGDYASGTNHTLPTNGYAKNYSGVSVDSFVKKITFQQINSTGIKNIGPAIEEMAEAEELFAHKNAVTLRLKSLES
jgi:histidinol dehydrogenase